MNYKDEGTCKYTCPLYDFWCDFVFLVPLKHQMRILLTITNLILSLEDKKNF